MNTFIVVYLFWYCLPYPMTFIRKKHVKGMPWNMCYLKLNHRNIKTRISLTKQSVYSQMKDNDTIYWRKDQYHHQIHIKLLHRQHYCDTYNYANTGIKKNWFDQTDFMQMQSILSKTANGLLEGEQRRW